MSGIGGFMGKSSTSFKKNQSGNPKGPPKKEFTKRAFFDAFFSAKDPKTKKTRIEVVLEAYYKNAIEKEDTNTQKHIIDQIYGKAKETLDANLSGEVNIIINKTVDK